MKMLKVDDKWSIEYDETCNDRPVNLYRNGCIIPKGFNNLEVSMFYALLDMVGCDCDDIIESAKDAADEAYHS